MSTENRYLLNFWIAQFLSSFKKSLSIPSEFQFSNPSDHVNHVYVFILNLPPPRPQIYLPPTSYLRHQSNPLAIYCLSYIILSYIYMRVSVQLYICTRSCFYACVFLLFPVLFYFIVFYFTFCLINFVIHFKYIFWNFFLNRFFFIQFVISSLFFFRSKKEKKEERCISKKKRKKKKKTYSSLKIYDLPSAINLSVLLDSLVGQDNPWHLPTNPGHSVLYKSQSKIACVMFVKVRVATLRGCVFIYYSVTMQILNGRSATIRKQLNTTSHQSDSP